jgi:phosphoglycolate phosphatase
MIGSAILEKFDSFLFDCDGVLWHFDHLLPNIKETLEMLCGMDKKVVFVTNNSTKSRAQYKKSMNAYGIQVSEDEIYCSGYVAAHYLKETYPDVKKAYVIGEEGIHEELKVAGVESFGILDKNKEMDQNLFKKIPDREFEDIGAVIVGWDRGFNFYKLCYATLCLQVNPKCHFIATNCDSCDKVTDTRFIPVGGAIVASVEKGTGISPYIAGKPNPYVIDLIIREHKCIKSKMIMVGDRLDTDIQLAINGEIASLLVFSGVTSPSDLEKSSIKPTYTLNQLGDLYKK